MNWSEEEWWDDYLREEEEEAEAERGHRYEPGQDDDGQMRMGTKVEAQAQAEL